jgi:phosphotransferase system HPr (HPr) family protein
MNGQTLQQTVVITNPRGFHLRPMSAFVQAASRFQSNVAVLWDGRQANGKSMFDLMMLAAPEGSQFTLEVEGPDAPAALDALVTVDAPAALDALVTVLQTHVRED